MGYGAVAFPRVPPPRRRPGGVHGKATLGALSLPAGPDEDTDGDSDHPERTVPLAVDLRGGVDQSGLPHPSSAPRDPDTGLPMYPTGPLTQTPKWKKRNKPRSQFVKSIMLLAALVTIWIAVWQTMETLRPNDPPPEPEPPVTTTVPVEPATPGSAVGARPS